MIDNEPTTQQKNTSRQPFLNFKKTKFSNIKKKKKKILKEALTKEEI